MGVPAGRSLGDEWFSRAALCVLVAAPSDCGDSGSFAGYPGTERGLGFAEVIPLADVNMVALVWLSFEAAVLALDWPQTRV